MISTRCLSFLAIITGLSSWTTAFVHRHLQSTWLLPSTNMEKSLRRNKLNNSGRLFMSTTTDSRKDDAIAGRTSYPGTPSSRVIERIAIAGGGVGGLTAALCLLKRGYDVTVYEKTAAFARFGGPIQVASNALSVIKSIDDELFRRVMDKFTFTGTRTCGIKDGVRSDGSFRMTEDAWDYLINPDSPPDWFVKFPLKQCADIFGLPYTGVIDRPDLQEILLDECKKIKPDFIQNGNPVQSYESHGAGRGVTITLADESTAHADLLIGADGIWSAIRAQMYNEGPVKQMNKDRTRRQGCHYSGYTVFAGETILAKPDYHDTGYIVYIGPQRYFVSSDVGNGRIQWYAFLSLPPGTKKAPSGWGGSTRSEQADPEENLIDYLKGLHAGWSDEIMTVLDATSPDNVEQRDLYDRPPELLRSWASGNVILVGDAVHAMMPNLGQGGCQAIEDAYILAETLDQHVTSSKEEIEPALQEFYRKRIVRVSIVQLLSKLASDLVIHAFDTPWSPHDNKGTSWKSYLTFFWKPILQYVIFPLQFAYLYSYHPSGSMRETTARLTEKWKRRHARESREVFEAYEKEGAGACQARGPSFFQQSEVSSTTALAAKKDN